MLGERLGLPVNRVQLGDFKGKAGSLHYDVASPGSPAVQFLRIAGEFGVEMRRGWGKPYRGMATYDREGADLTAHWQKLQQYFTEPEIWDRTDFFDQTIHNLRHGENYLLTRDGNKFRVHLIDNGGAFDGRVYDGKLPSLDIELQQYSDFLSSLLKPKRSLYLQNVLPDMQRFAALSPAAIKADVAEIPEQFLPSPYRQQAETRLLRKQELVRSFLAGQGPVWVGK